MNEWFEAKQGSEGYGKVMVAGGGKLDALSASELDSLHYYPATGDRKNQCFFYLKAPASMQTDAKAGGVKEGVMYPYNCWVCCMFSPVENKIYCVKSGGCDCTAGAPADCTHIGMLLSLIVRLTSCTSLEQAWGRTRRVATRTDWTGFQELQTYHDALRAPAATKAKKLHAKKKAGWKTPDAKTKSKKKKKTLEGKAADVELTPVKVDLLTNKADNVKYDISNPKFLKACAEFFENTRRNLARRFTTAAEANCVQSNPEYQLQLAAVREKLGPIKVAPTGPAFDSDSSEASDIDDLADACNT
jgi:hypothetical protein